MEDPNGVSIEQCAQCLLPVGTTTGHFLLSGWGNGREVLAPLTNEEEVVVHGVSGVRHVLRVCFFFTSRGRCVVSCAFSASCASYMSCLRITCTTGA